MTLGQLLIQAAEIPCSPTHQAHHCLALNPSIATLSSLSIERRLLYATNWDKLTDFFESVKWTLREQIESQAPVIGLTINAPNQRGDSDCDWVYALLVDDKPSDLSIVEWLSQPAHPFYQIWLSFVHWGILNEIAIRLEPQNDNVLWLTADPIASDTPIQKPILTDAELLDWLEQNFLHRGMDPFDRQVRPNMQMWVIFTPDHGPGYKTVRQHLTNAVIETQTTVYGPIMRKHQNDE